MKKLDTSFITTQIGMPLKGGSLRHVQEAYTEAIAETAKSVIGNNYNPNVTYILSGMVNASAHPQYNISAGSVFRNGEVYLFDAVNINVGGNTAVLSTIQTFATGTDADGVEFTDGIIRNVHQINKAQLTAGAAGTTNLGNYVDAVRINSNRPDTNIIAGSGISVSGTFPNFTVANTAPALPSPILYYHKIFIGDLNTDPGDGYTSVLSGSNNGLSAYVHNFPVALSGTILPVLQIGNGGHDTYAKFSDNDGCWIQLGAWDNTKMYFSIGTYNSSKVQALDLFYHVIQLP